MNKLITNSEKAALNLNSYVISALSGILFFVVAHPFIFNLVDKLISYVIDVDSLPRDVLVLIHSFVFSALMFVSIYLVVNYL